MAKFNEKISTILNAQLPEVIVADHPKFADFLKSYYQLLESAELKVKDVETTVGVLIETETGQENNLVYDATRIGSAITNIDEGDKILLEETPSVAYALESDSDAEFVSVIFPPDIDTFAVLEYQPKVQVLVEGIPSVAKSLFCTILA